MYGLNPIRKQEPDTDGNLFVEEIFLTIQGEGPLAGTPAVFVRLSGCNLKCHYCDTQFEEGMLRQGYSAYSICSLVRILTEDNATNLVVLTGGEPMRQDIYPLCKTLSDKGYQVQIETAGTLWIPGLQQLIEEGFVVLVCSPKTPSIKPEIAASCRHWKYIISEGETSEEDGLPNMSTQVVGKSAQLFRAPLAGLTNIIYVQPCDVPDPVQKQKNIEEAVRVAIKYGYKMSVQLHKTLGLP